MSLDGVLSRIAEIRNAHASLGPAAVGSVASTPTRAATSAPTTAGGSGGSSGMLAPAAGSISFADVLDAAASRRQLVSTITGAAVPGPAAFGGGVARLPGTSGPATATPAGYTSGVALPTTGDLGPLPDAARRYVGLIDAAAAAEGLDPALLRAVAWTESGFDAGAVSRAGATGLLQLMPATAASLGVDPTDPADNARGGARYLRQQLDRFGRVDLALAAYNAGPGAVQRHGGIPPYAETQAYVRRVIERAQQLGGTR
ncbi:MAG: transglycosylase SLT domain-containing protein [Actinomycetota bacterium]|nr:transglycosylase SLT domain-containing protein [Actinomycetota bacterium]